MTIFEQIFFDLGPIIFALAGFGVAFYVFIKKKTAQPMVCPLNGHCDVVTSSRFSKFFGIPVERIGMVYYALIMLVYVVHNLIPWLLSETAIFLVTGVTIGAFAFSAYLVFLQGFVIRQWCTWCLFSAGFSTLIFITAVFGANIELVPLLAKYKTFIVILHALAAAIGLGAATVTDIFFFRFLKDYKISTGENEMMKTLSNVIWFALGLMIVTGVGLFLPESERLLESSKFLTKLVAVGVVIVNGIFLNFVVSPRLVDISFGEPHDHKSGELHFMRKLSFALGAVSIVSWYTIFILGSLKSIPVSFGTALSLYVLLLASAITMSQLFDRKMVRDYSKSHRDQTPPKPPSIDNSGTN